MTFFLEPRTIIKNLNDVVLHEDHQISFTGCLTQIPKNDKGIFFGDMVFYKKKYPLVKKYDSEYIRFNPQVIVGNLTYVSGIFSTPDGHEEYEKLHFNIIKSLQTQNDLCLYPCEISFLAKSNPNRISLVDSSYHNTSSFVPLPSKELKNLLPPEYFLADY